MSIVIGENEKANRLSKALLQKGFLIQAIKEPTVPKNTARLRLSLTSSIPEEEIKRFVKELRYEMDFLFNGWGMTEEAFPHLSLDQVEIINYPYDRIETLLKNMKMILCMLLPGRLEPITFPNSDRNSKSFSQKLY